MKKINFPDLEYRLLKYLLKNGGRPDEIDISPFLKKYAKTNFQFIYTRLEHNVNNSGFAKIRVFQRLGENHLPYSEFLGTLTDDGKIYLEEMAEKNENRLIKIGSFIITFISVIISVFSLCFSRANLNKNSILEKKVYRLEQNQQSLNLKINYLESEVQNLSVFHYRKEHNGLEEQIKKKLLKTQDRKDKR